MQLFPALREKYGFSRKFVQGPVIMNREVDIYFFHIPMHIELDVNSWKWTFYKPEKTYLSFPGVFEGGEDIQSMRFVNLSDEEDSHANE